MTVTALVTEGSGNHSAEKWAHATAQAIIQIDPQMQGERRDAALALQQKVEEAITPHYYMVMQREAENLVMFHDHCDTALKVLDIAEDALHLIQVLVQDTPWAAKLKDAEWALCALETLASHLATAAHIERLLHADKNPDNAAAAAYKLKHQGQ